MKTILVFSGILMSIAVLMTPFACEKGAETTNFTLMGIDFNDTLPTRYTCDGLGRSPALFWAGAPDGTQSFAITMHQDLGNGQEQICMVKYHIDGIINELESGGEKMGVWGINNINDQAGYGAPCANGKKNQEYIITIYALSKAVALRPSNTTVTKAELELAMSSIILGKASKRIVLERAPSLAFA